MRFPAPLCGDSHRNTKQQQRFKNLEQLQNWEMKEDSMRKRVAGKRAVALVMASLMMTSMVGCGGKGAAGGSSTKVNDDGTIDTSKHEVINMLVLGNKPTNGRLEAMLDKLNPILTEKVNAELEFTYVEWTDWQTQYNLKLLSGDSSLDLICTATDWLFGW